MTCVDEHLPSTREKRARWSTLTRQKRAEWLTWTEKSAVVDVNCIFHDLLYDKCRMVDVDGCIFLGRQQAALFITPGRFPFCAVFLGTKNSATVLLCLLKLLKSVPNTKTVNKSFKMMITILLFFPSLTF